MNCNKLSEDGVRGGRGRGVTGDKIGVYAGAYRLLPQVYSVQTRMSGNVYSQPNFLFVRAAKVVQASRLKQRAF